MQLRNTAACWLYLFPLSEGSASDDLRRRLAIPRFYVRQERGRSELAGLQGVRASADQVFNIACGDRITVNSMLQQINKSPARTSRRFMLSSVPATSSIHRRTSPGPGADLGYEPEGELCRRAASYHRVVPEYIYGLTVTSIRELETPPLPSLAVARIMHFPARFRLR